MTFSSPSCFWFLGYGQWRSRALCPFWVWGIKWDAWAYTWVDYVQARTLPIVLFLQSSFTIFSYTSKFCLSWIIIHNKAEKLFILEFWVYNVPISIPSPMFTSLNRCTSFPPAPKLLLWQTCFSFFSPLSFRHCDLLYCY